MDDHQTATRHSPEATVAETAPIHDDDHTIQDEPNQGVTKTLTSVYSNYLLNILASSSSNFIGKLSFLSRRTRALSYFSIFRRRRACLPLPLPSYSPESSLVVKEASGVYDVLEDIIEHVLINLHNVRKHLHFWQCRAEGSDSRKLYFMMFERGPMAFIDGTVKLLRQCMTEGPTSMHRVSQSASVYMSERLAVLTELRRALATFLAEVYMEVDKCGEALVKDPEKSFPSLLITLNGFFSNLEASIGHLHAARQTDSSVDGSYSFPLVFETLPEVNQEGSQWTGCEIKDAINLVNKNLQKLDSYISDIVAKHQKPKKVTQYWVRYTCGAVGLSVCSMWLIKHSRLVGSPDIDNWIREAKESTVSFFSDHVEQPLLSIRDELFDTFRKRHKGVMEVEEVQLTAKSLHRMLMAFTEQTKGQKVPENASEQELLEIVMNRYEKELMHPIQNLLSGELARGLLIQVQKLKLDIETAMLELDQILKANEINFAVLAALPAFFLSLLLLMVVRAWFKRDTKAEGKGRIARRQRRLLLVEVEKRIMQYQTFIDQGLEKESQCMFGLMLCSLDRLFHAVQGHAEATGEWQCLKQDILDLGKPGIQTTYKLVVTSRMERVYECLLPSLKQQ
ncbi:protein DGS1, mitochondrial [Mercurialis annua]|uniref:protein DGS1, mitochondrial n=1 Tax=Mercurialis annua TaxID=3986 RepID=UPI00215F96DC|nr:protein DGS1, mitochondrial [Mercurialis annua]